MTNKSKCKCCGHTNEVKHGKIKCSYCGANSAQQAQAEQDLTTAVNYANTISNVFNTYFKG